MKNGLGKTESFYIPREIAAPFQLHSEHSSPGKTSLDLASSVDSAANHHSKFVPLEDYPDVTLEKVIRCDTSWAVVFDSFIYSIVDLRRRAIGLSQACC